MTAPSLHVLFRKEELREAAPRVTIVVDVLFATTTIAAALHGGAAEVVPVMAPHEAEMLRDGSALLAGEHNMLLLDGFAPPTPLALLACGVAGRRLVYSTTNGTVALRRAAEAGGAVYAAALVNAPAVAAHVIAHHPGESVLVLCAGSGGALNLEDAVGAGCLVQLLEAGAPGCWRLTDAALAGQGLYQRWEPDPAEALRQSRIGRLMAAAAMDAEVAFAARVGELNVVPALRGGRLRPA